MSDELTKPEGGEISAGFEAFASAEELQQALSAFEDNVNSSEILYSRMGIMQDKTPEIENQIQGYRQGQLFDNQTREILTRKIPAPWLVGKVDPDSIPKYETCLIVPVFKLPTEFVKWKDRSKGEKGWEFKTLDRSDPRVRAGLWPKSGGTWGNKPEEKGKKPPVTENINYLCVVLDAIDHSVIKNFIIITFAVTSFKAGQKLTKFIMELKSKNIPPFGKTFYLYGYQTPNAAGIKYYTIGVQEGPIITAVNQEIIPDVINMSKFLADKEHGRERQETLLNAADVINEEDDTDIANDNTPTDGGSVGEPAF
jgi:hypothetical protein